VQHFLFTVAGIITSFIILALLVIGLKQIGYAVGWGFHFQEPAFLVVMIIILLLFAANMWGMFEIRLPRFVADLAGYPAAGNHFFSGVLVTLLATPCSAPFLGTAVGFALAQPSLWIMGIFLAIGMGLATPYFVLMLVPGLIRHMPKP